MPDEPNFDWSLGEEGDTADVETTPVGERGAQAAEPNRLNVQELAQQAEEADEGDTGDQAGDEPDEGPAAQAADQDGGDEDQDAGGEGDGLILGKFKTTEDLAEAYKNAESRLGQQGTEVGTLRRELDEMKGYLQAQREQTPQTQITDDLVSQVDELAVSNPQGAAQWALENQPLLYNRVMQIWASQDPLGAGRFENLMMREQLKQEMEEKFSKEYAPVAETVTEAAQAQQFDSAWKTVSAKLPDLKTFANEMMDAAAGAPELAQALQSGDVASKERLIENLYWLAKGRQADTIAAAATDLGRKQQKQAVDEKKSAAVASGSSSQARGEKTNIETWKEQFLEAPSTSIAENYREATR